MVTRNTLEQDFGESLADTLRSHGVDVRKVHGNLYSSGYPDYHAVNDRGFVWYETKVLQQRNPNMKDLVKACRPSQREILKAFGRSRKHQVYVVAWCFVHDQYAIVHPQDMPAVLTLPASWPRTPLLPGFGITLDSLVKKFR